MWGTGGAAEEENEDRGSGFRGSRGFWGESSGEYRGERRNGWRFPRGVGRYHPYEGHIENNLSNEYPLSYSARGRYRGRRKGYNDRGFRKGYDAGRYHYQEESHEGNQESEASEWVPRTGSYRRGIINRRSGRSRYFRFDAPEAEAREQEREDEIEAEVIDNPVRGVYQSQMAPATDNDLIMTAKEWSMVMEEEKLKKNSKEEKVQKTPTVDELTKSIHELAVQDTEKVKTEKSAQKILEEIIKKEEEIKAAIQKEREQAQIIRSKELEQEKRKMEREMIIKQIEDISRMMETYFCPITREVMKDPVSAEDGHTYERQCIETWLINNAISPLTRMQIGRKLIPNHKAKTTILELKEKLALLEARLKVLAA